MSTNDEIYIESDESDINQINKNTNEKSNCDKIIHKMDLININNGWNDNNEKIIISIADNCASYKWMHEKCSQYHRLVNSIINIMLIFFSSILTAETFVVDSDHPEFILVVLRKLTVYLVTFLSVLQNFLNSERLSITHLNAANEFSKLYHDIQQQMCRFRRERKNATKYVADCLKRYDSLVVTNPDINKFVLIKFKSEFKNNVPSVDDRFNKIEIITEPSQNTNSNSNDEKHLTNKNVTNNLHHIHNIIGDISDHDLENLNSIELKRLNENKIKYEYNRFLQHSDEMD